MRHHPITQFKSLPMLLILCAAPLLAANPPATDPAKLLANAAAVWHFADAQSTDGKTPLTVKGDVKLGVELQDADRRESLARGGDGRVAEFRGGGIEVAPAAADALNINGDSLTLLLRLRIPSGAIQSGELFSRHGGHDNLVFNLFSHNKTDKGDMLGFELGIDGTIGLNGQVSIPWNSIDPAQWHDVVVRYDGIAVNLFVDGMLMAQQRCSGKLRQGNREPLLIGRRGFQGQIDHAAIWARALSVDEILALSGGSGGGAKLKEKLSREIEAVIGREGLTNADQLRGARELRQRLWNDPYRPRYHLLPPDGLWNDINGAIFWKGRYHVFFLGRLAPDRDTILSGKDSLHPRETWLHASSRDLVHWIHHPPALVPAFDGSMPRGLFSGDMIENAPVPTIIVHVPGQGTCIFTAEDDELNHWKPLPQNPVIPQPKDKVDYVVFDPCAWKENDVYYALVGNKNRAPGHDGDCTSLFRSKDLAHWEYLHPFYKSDRKWTAEVEDCACPDFFPLGNKHMLLMHTHRPYGQCQYYIGRYENEHFYPEIHGRMTWPDGSLCAPETLRDDKGRRIFWGWVPGGGAATGAWSSMASLPRVLSLADDGTLRIEPAPELASLRLNPREHANITIPDDADVNLDDIRGDTLELSFDIDPADAKEFGAAVWCSASGDERTSITCTPSQQTIKITSTVQLISSPGASRPTTREQIAPFDYRPGETLHLRIFLDRSVIEVFANDRQCLTQRVQPGRPDSLGVKLFSRGGKMCIRSLKAWAIEPTNSW